MISGFNTDIEFQGTVYHVQTEDKGLSARMIVSLVYERGTILASKRVSYDDLVAVNFDEKELADSLARQHKLICAAVRAGRLSELKEMTARSAAARAKIKADAVPALVDIKVPVDPAFTAPVLKASPRAPISRAEPIIPRSPIKIAMVEPERMIELVPQQSFRDELVIDEVRIVDDEEIELLPAEAIAAFSELSGQERTANTKLSLELLGESKFKGGDRRTVNIMVCRGTDRKVIADAQIMVKILGSSFRPVIFHAKTDSNGIARVHLQLPRFQAGRAALLIRTMNNGEEIELRRVVAPG